MMNPRNFGPHRGDAMRAMARSLAVLAIVLAGAAVALSFITNGNEASRFIEERRNHTFSVDETLLRPVPPDDGPGRALQNAIATLVSRPKDERSFASRDAALAALLPLVMRSSDYPRVASVVETHEKVIKPIEREIAQANRQSVLLAALRRRDFALDGLRLDLARLHERQQAFVADAVEDFNEVVRARDARAKLDAQKHPRAETASLLEQMVDSKHSLHVIYEALFYFSFVVVALAIAYCAAILLRILPFPGAAEKWSGKMEDAFSTDRRAESPKSTSPLASILLTTTVLGVGVMAASDPLHDRPGSPFFHARLASLLPTPRQEYGMQRVEGEGASASPANVTVEMPPYPNMTPHFEFSPVNPISVPACPSPMVTVEAKPGEVDGLKETLQALTLQSARTATLLDTMQERVEQEAAKTDQVREMMELARKEWQSVGTKVEKAGNELRNTILTANYNDEQRHLLAARQEAIAGARSPWRSVLMLGLYQVTGATRTVLETESCAAEERHEQLRAALAKMESEMLDPLYQSPFETTIIDRMVGREARLKHTPAFISARQELWRHLPVVLETARIAEKGLRKP